MTQSKELTLLGADVSSNRGVNHETDCTNLDLAEGYPTLVADRCIPLADFTPRMTDSYEASYGNRLRSAFSFGRREEDSSAPSGGCG